MYWNADSIVDKLRAGTIDDPYVDKDESLKISSGQVQLDELPYTPYGVLVTSYGESKTPVNLTNTLFYVDYKNGIVYFNESENGKFVNVKYKGIGYQSIPASRIWTQQKDGNISQTLQSIKNSTLVSLFDFGAKGDGVTDDTVAIQRCFDTISPSTTVFVPDGVFIVSGVRAYQKSRLNIVSNGGTFKLKNNSTKPVLKLEECPYSSIRGLSIDGNKNNQTNLNDGIVFKATYFSLILHCRIVDCKRDGLQIIGYYDSIDTSLFRGCDEVHVNNCFIQSNARYGLFVDSVADLSINDNNIEFNGDNGITLTQTTGIPSGNISIVNNQILSNDGHGFEILSDTSRMMIGYNHIRNNGKLGLRYIGGKQFNISNNNIHLNGRLFPYSAAIIVGYANSGIIMGNMISCTDFSPTQGYAIELVSVNSIIVTNNLCQNNLTAGINLQDCTAIKIAMNIGLSDATIA